MYLSPHWSLVPPQGLHLPHETSSIGQFELEEVVLPQGLGMDVDLQVPPTNIVDEVGGQEDLERVMEEEVWLTNLDDEVKSVCPLALIGVPTLVLVGVPPLALPKVLSLCPKNSTYHGSPHRMGTPNWGGDVDVQVPPINMKDEIGGQQGLERSVKAEVGGDKLGI